MRKKVSPIPRGYRTSTQCLTVISVDSAVAFYKAAFNAEVLNSHLSVDDSIIVHATMKIGNSLIALNKEAPEQGVFSPLNTGVSGSQIHLYVDDVDASWNRAVEAGAQIRNPLFDAYWGDRTGLLADNDGHIWSIASKIENISKEEINKRSKMGLISDEISDDSEVEISVDAEVSCLAEIVSTQEVFATI